MPTREGTGIGVLRRMVWALCAVLAFGTPCWSQQILLDQGVRAAGLWCFPLATNPKEYLYLPSDGRLSVGKSGGPEFSYLRYVENVKSESETSSTITEGAGGGVLHFLAEYSTPEAQVEKARAALKEVVKDEEVKLRGPVVFTSGRYTIISSVAKVDDPSASADGASRKMLATGNAPVLEGSKIAVSFSLDKRDAQILYNSFQMANPDISVVFEMQFEGLNDAYDATLDVDWSEVRKDKQFGAGVKLYVIGAEVDVAFKRLMQNNAIKLTSRGEHASSEALLNTVYAKLLELLFRKADDPPAPAQQQGAISSLMSLIGGSSSQRSSVFSLTGTYKLRDIQSSGHTVLNFNHQGLSQRTALISFNVGDLFERYGTDQNYFKAVNLADPVYSQREVLVSVDGSLLGDFDKYINNVSITVKKEHQSGDSTVGEVVVDRSSFTQNANRFSMIYGWNGDSDRNKWLEYQYRTKWSFRDGGTLEEDWRTTNSPMINIVPPYERREISIEGDAKTLTDAGVKYSVVKLAYDFFGKSRNKQVVVRAKDDLVQEKIELIQPKDVYSYDYEIKWHLADGTELSRPLSTDASGIVFVDELPK